MTVKKFSNISSKYRGFKKTKGTIVNGRSSALSTKKRKKKTEHLATKCSNIDGFKYIDIKI